MSASKSSIRARYGNIGILALACFALLIWARLQILLALGTVDYRLLTCFLWGTSYDAAVALAFGALLCFAAATGLARVAPWFTLVFFVFLQLFETTNVYFYRFFGFHLDFRFWEYMTVSNTIKISDSIRSLVNPSDFAGLFVLPMCLIGGAVFISTGLCHRRSRPTGWRGLGTGSALCLLAVFFNYLGNVAPGKVLHDSSGLGVQPIFRAAEFFLKNSERKQKIDLAQEIPPKILAVFQKSYNRSPRWRLVSAKYPWLRAPLKEVSPAKGALRKKNVVFVFLESFGSMSVTPLSPVFHDVTPNIERLSHQGVLFSHAYYNVNPTAPAESAILCSVYSDGSILTDFKTKLPCAGTILEKYGYSTNLIGGNHLNYDNQFDFWLAHGFRNIIDEGSFWFAPSHPDVPGHWGKYVDSDVFDESLQWMDSVQDKPAPFFLMVKTASSHSPYPEVDARFNTTEGATPGQRRMNSSMKYVDHELGRFIDRLASRSYYKNTIFFIFGDHAPNEVQQWPGGADFNTFVPHAGVPLLILNPEKMEKEKGHQIDWVVSHVDILPTVLDMLNIATKQPFAGHSIVDASISPQSRYAFVLDRARGRRGMITSKYAYAWDDRLKLTSLYDLAVDPYSRNDISGKLLQVTRGFKNVVRALTYVSRWSFEHNRFVPSQPDPELPKAPEVERHASIKLLGRAS